MKKKPDTKQLRHALLFSPLLALPMAGQAVAPAGATAQDDASDVVVLSPFEVSAEAEVGYAAATTLAGNRLNTELRDIGNAVSVITSQFLRDTGAVNNETLLQYTTGTEVGSVQGNFAGVGDGPLLDETSRFVNPNQNTRVRGLAAADNTRDYFLTSVPWDGYNVDRVDLQRGPNSILFGQGSPAGIINTGTKQAGFRNSGEVDLRFGSYGTTRATLDINHVLIADELAIRVAGLREKEKFQQDPAYELDKRIFAAVRYEPRFLKRGDARTIIRANFEAGDIDSNRPRMLPPIDFITPWFQTGTYTGRYDRNGTYRDPATGQVVEVKAGDPRVFQHLNRATYNPFQLQDDNTGIPNHGQQRPGINGGPDSGFINPYFQPMIGNFGQSFGGPMVWFDGATGAPAGNPRIHEIRQTRGINGNPTDTTPDGSVDGGIGGIPFHRPGGINNYASFARLAGLPFGEFGVYRNVNLTDPSVFNFYDQLIDGPNKREWQDFETFNISLAQTFFNDKFGFEAVYNQEDWKGGQLSLLSGGRQGLYIDFMSVFSDGSPTGLNGEPYQDGTPNPNVGRPFITDSGQGGNNETTVERESARITAFFTHDFSQGRTNWLNRILGRHTITGLFAEDTDERDNRQWQRYAILDPEYRNFMGLPNAKFNANELALSPVIYLGPSLLNSSSASGANIPNPKAEITLSAPSVRVFDSTWNAHGVNPSDPWENTYYPVGHASRNSYQAENPANYVGWITKPITVTDSEATDGGRDALTTFARLTKSKLESKALVWQGHLLDRALVGTYGYREDTAKSWAFERQTQFTDGFGQLDLGNSYRLPNDPSNILDVTSRAYSIVAHLNRLPFLSDLLERSPITVSLFYNRSSNFQPAANRVDAYGEPLPSPAGITHDRGILFETRDGRYSFRINKYETRVSNNSVDGVEGTWFIGASQAWSGNWVNRFEFNWTGDTNANAVASPDPTNTQYNYGTAPGETLEDAQAREAAAIAAWRQWQAQVDPRFYAAWGINLNNHSQPIGASAPAGFTITSDAISEGYEFELNASPTRNWRLTLNASKTEARRNNIGGTALAEFIAGYENALRTTAAGDLRIWWGGAGNETALFQWNNNFGSNWTALKLQEGTNVPEMREWRVNAITNYDFTEGRLAGLNVGLGLRWEDEVVIGYPPIPGDVPGTVSFDLSSPYYGPSETHVDFWIGYGRRLTPKIDWRIQLNVRNAFEDDGLIPITAQPDGTPAGYRIAPSQIWTVSNTFRF